MLKKLLSLILTFMLLEMTLLSLLPLPPVRANSDSVRLIRIPEDVKSLQPVIILAKVGEEFDKIELDVSIKISCEDGPICSNLKFSKTFSLRMVPLAFDEDNNFFMTLIPGLPSVEKERLVGKKVIITSEVDYKLKLDNDIRASGSYKVNIKQATLIKPPIVFNIPTILPGWNTDSSEELNVKVIAFDDKGIKDASLEFSVNGGSWQKAPATLDPSIKLLQEIIDKINDIIKRINDALNVNLPSISLPILILNGFIPFRNSGDVVKFRSVAKDVDDRNAESLISYYYVDKGDSNVKVLIIDPFVMLYFIQDNLNKISNILTNLEDYEFVEDVLKNLITKNVLSGVLNDFKLIPFHNWQYLGESYDIYIIYPSQNQTIVNLLEEFKPDVIVLSNLWLGLNETLFGTLFNWDLNSLMVLDDIISYVRTNNAGLIVTHGTLSDWMIGCSPSFKVGSRGHVGDSIEDMNITDERVLSTMLGMPLLPLWEYLRNNVADGLCKSEKIIGDLLASIPLQVPYVPANEEIVVTEDGKKHDILKDLPDEMKVTINEIRSKFRFSYFTQVGWQLSFPSLLVSKARDSVDELKEGLEDVLIKIKDFLDISALETPEILKNSIQATLNYLTKDMPSLHNLLNKLKHKLIIKEEKIKEKLKLIKLRLPSLGVSKARLDTVSLADLLSIFSIFHGKIIAISKDGLAGIITYDKFWDTNGYRSVYFSFEVESSDTEDAKRLLLNSVKWASMWRFMDISSLISKLMVPKDVATKFYELLESLEGDLILSEKEVVITSKGTLIKVKSKAGLINLLIAHPTIKELRVKVKGADHEVVKVTDSVTLIKVELDKKGKFKVILSGEGKLILNPAVIAIKHKR